MISTRRHGTACPWRGTASPSSGPDQRSSTAFAIAADALPAPTTMVRPFGFGGRYGEIVCAGNATLIAASNIARRRSHGGIGARLVAATLIGSATPAKARRTTDATSGLGRR